MKAKIAAAAVAALCGLAVQAAPAAAWVYHQPRVCPARPTPLVCRVHAYVTLTWRAEARHGLARTRYAGCAERPHSDAYLLWCGSIWKRRFHHVLLLPVPTDPVGTGRLLAAERGWTGAEWADLYALWNHESGWDPTALNAGSGACGVPQFVPCRDWGDATAQIRDGLAYIAGRYGTPAAAWGHELAYGWY